MKCPGDGHSPSQVSGCPECHFDEMTFAVRTNKNAWSPRPGIGMAEITGYEDWRSRVKCKGQTDGDGSQGAGDFR
jgi:hypothetical protein